MKVRIIDIHPDDAFYDKREHIIGKEGTLIEYDTHPDGFVTGDFEGGYGFFKVKVEEIE